MKTYLLLIISALSCGLLHAGSRANVEAEVYEEGYYPADEDADWYGPGWYSGIYFEDEDAYWEWQSRHPHWHKRRWHRTHWYKRHDHN